MVESARCVFLLEHQPEIPGQLWLAISKRHATRSSIAESAVNEVVSLRCAKKRQMRWTNKGAHLLVQVRVAVLNGQLKMREMPEPRRFTPEEKSSVRCERFA